MKAAQAAAKPLPMYQNRKLRRRFTVSVLVFAVVLLGLWLVYQQILFAHIQKAANETITLTESHLQTVLDDAFSDMKQTAALIAGNGGVQEFLAESDVLRRYALAADISETVRTAAYPSFTGDNLLMVTADSSVFQFTGNISTDGIEVIKDHALAGGGKVYTVLELDNGRFFCFSNPVYRRADGKSVPVGYVIALSNLAKVRRILTRLDAPDGVETAVILDNVILLSSNSELDGQDAGALRRLYGSVTTAQVTGNGLYTATAITKETMQEETQLFYRVSAVTLVLLIILIAAMFRWLSARMVSPMLQNAEDMQMGLLKLQISAHFVFNTISAIKGLSEKGENEKAALAAENLAGMLKNLHEADEESNIFDQLQNLNRYITIMNIRHSGKFAADIDADDRLGDYKMPGQILQPLAENALTHGLLTKTGACKLNVCGRIETEALIFEVSDNGIGMEEAQIKALQDMLDRAGDWDYSEYRLKGVALLNIQKRIRARYGEQYGLTLRGGPGFGLTVTVRLPLIKE